MMDVSLQYLAGLVDGEGCLMITRLRNVPGYKSGRCRFAPVMTITNIHLPMLQMVQLQWGGRLREERPNIYALWFNSSQMRKVIPSILPYLIVKRDQALIMIEYLSELKKSGSSVLSDDQYAKYEGWFNALRQMKDVRFHSAGA